MDIQNAKIGLASLHSFSDPGGVQNHVIALYREFKQRGMNVKIIAPGRASSPHVAEEDVLHIGVSKHIPVNGSKSDFGVSFRKSARRRIREEKFDIVHFHNLGNGPLALQILRQLTSTNILTVHGAADATITAKFPLVFFSRLYIQRVYGKKFHGLIAVSPAAINTIQTFGGFHNGPIRTIPNGIDLSEFSPDAPLLSRFYGDEKQNILFVGRFEKRKGLQYLLHAYEIVAKERNDLRLIIVGEGEGRKKAEEFVREKQLSNVFFEGRVDSALLPSYYRTANVFCAPSVQGESFGITLLEAMACGTPITGFSNPGYAWVMKDHEKKLGACLLANPKNSKELAGKIQLLLDNNALRTRARTWGLARCQEFTWTRVADEVLEFYEEVWSRK